MLTQEAAWLQAELAELPADRLDPILSIGSGTRHARELFQPWIAERVYRPLERRGIRIVHHEHRPGDGVDVAGDLADSAAAERLRAVGARSVLCCNVLEHLADRASVERLLVSLVAQGSYLVLTVPRRFPFHPDPIDTMFRPSVSELASEFPELQLVRGAEVSCGTLLAYLRNTGSIRQSIANGLRTSLGRRDRPDEERAAAAAPSGGARVSAPARIGMTARYLVQPTAVTCAVLAKGAPR